MNRAGAKKGEQLTLPKLRGPDKNGQFRGGARPGAGRPKRKDGRRSSEPHKVRSSQTRSQPIHVVVRVVPGLMSLRSIEGNIAIGNAMHNVLRHGDTFRIVHYSVQHTHIHLIVEADDKNALSLGMKSFGVSCAKHLNAAESALRGVRRRGPVFLDRYYAHTLKTSREVRNALAYVLNNWRHHRADRDRTRRPWEVDPFSSAFAFDGWKELGAGVLYEMPVDYESAPVWPPTSWLLRVGWRRRGLISMFEIPGEAAG